MSDKGWDTKIREWKVGKQEEKKRLGEGCWWLLSKCKYKKSVQIRYEDEMNH